MPGFLNENMGEIGNIVLRCLLQKFRLEFREVEDIVFQMWYLLSVE